MIYALILKPEYKKTLKIIVFIILVAFSATLYSCQTVYTEYYTPEQLKTGEDVKYIEVKTKSDSTINLSDYEVTYYEKYKDTSNILLVEKDYTTITKGEGLLRTYRTKKILTEIYLRDIKKIKVEKTKENIDNTILWISAAFIAVVVILIIAKRSVHLGYGAGP